MKQQDISIRKKLTVAIMGTTVTVLAITAVAFAVYEWFAFRTSHRTEIQVVAAILAFNTPEAISFEDKPEATNNLLLVTAERSIVAAALYRTNGEVFASFPANMPPDAFPDAPSDIEPRFEDDFLIVSQPVEYKGTRHGTLYVKSDVRDLYTRFWLYGAIVAVVLAGCAFIALLLSNVLQKNISEPILSLAGVARRVSEQRDYSVRARKFSNDEVGALTDAFNHMLTQIHERDAALRASEERFRQLANAVPAFVWTTDAQGNFNYVNERWSEYTGLPREEAMGFGWLKTIHPDDREARLRVWKEAVRTGSPLDSETRIRSASGEYRWFLGRAIPVRDAEGKITAWFGTNTDIEEKRRAEERITQINAELETRVQDRTAQLEASNRELEAFSYSVAHDLRSPLRSIDGFNQAFLEEYAGALPDEGKDLLQRSRHASQRMSQLIDDLLNLSRVSRAEMRRQKVNLSEIAAGVAADLQKSDPARQAEFIIEPDIIATGDDRLLGLVMENLLGNAFKFTRNNPHARIEFRSMMEEGRRVLFVRDNGAGFNMSYAGKLFGPFQRLHGITEYPGTGIGLATVHRILGRHGGRIWPQAEEGKGATFYFTLPA